MQNPTWGANKTLADYVKESAWQSSIVAPPVVASSSNMNRAGGAAPASSGNNATTSMPWVAAVKSPPEHSTLAANNSFDNYNSTIGNWSAPETSSSNRGGWNADGSSKGDGAFDDGTAIWGNPTTKKTGVDWTEKEMNPPHSQATNHNSAGGAHTSQSSEKRIQKPEPTISSLNGTEAWGAPARNPMNSQQQQQQQQQHQQQQQSNKNDNSGNTYGTKSINESLSWGEPSSLQAKHTNENSSPPNNSVWNNLGVNNNSTSTNKQKSSDWLSSSSSNSNNAASSRLDELNKQLESTSLFDSVSSSSMTKSASNNPNLEHLPIGIGIGGGGNGMNDLKQMSANYSNDLLDSPSRQSAALSSSNNQQSQQLDSAAYSSAVAPSRDLLKQMVHQIQLAVQAGHLNAHILNQPMSTPTLQLVYQLLQQIKTLHQLQEIQQRAGLKPSDISSPSNMDLQINRIRQNISLLQKAITQQQAALTKNSNETIGDISKQQQHQANNYSYATISKLSTNSKVPSSNMSNIISNSNIDSFRRSSLIDTLSNSNSDSLRSAQATFDANATIDKTLSSLIQASSANNILGSSNSNNSNKTITTSVDFSKAQSFTSGTVGEQSNKGLPSAQSSSSSAWTAFSSGDFASQQGWLSQLRISSNVSQDHQHQYSAFDMVSEFGQGKAWRSSSILSDVKDNSSTMAPGGNINVTRPSSNSNSLKHQMNENDILNRDPSLFCDWNNDSDSGKRNFDQISNSGASAFSSPAIGGLSLQSNPWMFAPTSSTLNIGTGIDNINKNSSSGGNLNIGNKLDNGNTDKMAGDSIFLKSNNAVNIQRSSSALYDWADLAPSTLQFNADNNQHMGKQQQQQASIGGGGARPPPGLLSKFGQIIGNSSSANGISLLDSKLGSSNEEAQSQSRGESSSSLWSGNWFD